MKQRLQQWQQRLPPQWRARTARFAKLGFWFFFIKGMLWLIVPVLLALWASEATAQADTLPVQALPQAAAETTEDDREQAIRLEQVVVTGTRTEHALGDSPVEVQLITAEQIKDSGARDVAADIVVVALR